MLSALLGAYLLLSVVELVRVALYDRPREYEVGFYQTERVNLPEGPREFRWTRGDSGGIVRPPWGPVMRIPIYYSHPELPEGGISVRLYVGDTLFDERHLDHNGRYRFDYYLPPILGFDPWRQDPRRMSPAGVAELEPVAGDEPFLSRRWVTRRTPDYLRVFTGWGAPAGPASQRFRVEASETFVPADYVDVGTIATRQQRPLLDQRVLGVGAGEILWLRQLPPEGLGFYGTETDDEQPFRWSAGRGSWPIAAAPPGSDALLFRLRVASPDAGERPVSVALYWNADAVGSESFSDGRWRQIRLRALPQASEAGVLSVVVSRTWSAMRAGVGADRRELGVAVSEPRWE
ncbi:MAG TPA: hypothetical protein QGG47_00235 [Acidobacteriota bacterium]|nr:hypothetical protein [Acidobacteriota bacterium]